MCFSAEVSFASGIVLSAAGAAAAGKADKPEQRVFACVPFLFALQQFIESLLWVTLKSGSLEWLRNAGTVIFLISALVVWPVAVPLAMLLMEKDALRRRILTGLLFSGVVLAVYYAFCIMTLSVTAQIEEHHILYIDNFPPQFINAAFFLYIAATVAPLFVSSVRRMKVFGVMIAVSLAVSSAIFAWYLTSVWCFFAAVSSMAIIWVLAGENRPQEEPAPAVI